MKNELSMKRMLFHSFDRATPGITAIKGSDFNFRILFWTVNNENFDFKPIKHEVIDVGVKSCLFAECNAVIASSEICTVLSTGVPVAFNMPTTLNVFSLVTLVVIQRHHEIAKLHHLFDN